MGNMKQKKKFYKLSGQSIIEFALVFPILLLLIFGAMDIGRLFYYKIVLTNAAREGANYLAYHTDPELNPNNNKYTTELASTYEVIEAEGENFNIDIIVEGENKEVDILLGDCTSSTKCLSGEQIGIKITKEIGLVLGGILQSFGLVSGPITVSSIIYMVVI
mgnify:CR=1 FL=1